MTERKQREGTDSQPAVAENAGLSTSRRRMMQAMALATVGTAAASVYVPTVLADTATGTDTNKGGPKKAATFPTTPGFSYLMFNGVNFEPEFNASTNGYKADSLAPYLLSEGASKLGKSCGLM